MNRRFFAIVGFLALVIYFVGIQANIRFLRIMSDQGILKINVEVVKTPEGKQLGLMGREDLPNGTGMLFVYDEEGSNPVMWMKNMLIPIDMVFIGRDLKINHIAKNVMPCIADLDRHCERHGSAVPSNFVLEVPAGFTTQYGIEYGNGVIMPSGA